MENSNSKVQDASLELRIERLELICEHMGEAVISASETVENLAIKIEAIVECLEQESAQTSQQRDRILALGELLQTLVEINTESTIGVKKLTSTIKDLLAIAN